MSELNNIFRSLPTEFQNLLHLAQDKLNIEVTPLQELKGGRTGAYLFLVSVTKLKSDQVHHLVLKLDHKNKKTKIDELDRHASAIDQSPPGFVLHHIADLTFERVEQDETIAIFYSIAGQSLHHFNSLASYQQQKQLEKIFSVTNDILLPKWNANLKFEKAVHPQKILSRWLGYRLQPGGNIEHFLEDLCHIDQNTTGLMIMGNVFPNPLLFSRDSEIWEAVRPIDTMVGLQHGDLNIGNILVKFSDDTTEITGFYLIDFALFKAGMPLLYDKCYLEMSYLIRELSRVSLDKWVGMITHFSNQDTVDTDEVPIELAGACAVINAGRRAFNNWVQDLHPSLSDDLWGQYWLAAVAAGLNYCNKTIIPEKERIAGLVFSAVHLKRFHSTFGVSLPVEVKHLDIINPAGNSLKAGSEIRLQKVQRHNLPSQMTSFLGRQKELAKINELIQRPDIRLVTLTGPGGTGKTRLALHVADGLLDSFEDGIYLIDLASISEVGPVLTAIARTIGIRETSSRSLIEEIKTNLKSKKLLLLLDNFEQVMAAAPSIMELLHECPQLKLLVTSREALHVRGEHVFSVPPLTLPGVDLNQQSLEKLVNYEAVQLFEERASALRSDFEITEENASSVAEICLRLDGLPLAIELAAARITMFSPRALLERVDNSLKLLHGGPRDLPVRQQTLRSTIDWSYKLLDKSQQQLLALLSVFNSCTYEEVEDVASGIRQMEETQIDIFDGLGSLLDKSLIQRADQDHGETRLLMLETIREYSREQLEQDTEFSKAARQAHAAYFGNFARFQWKRLTGDDREKVIKEIESDIDNVRTAWNYWVGEADLEQLQKLIDFLWMFYDARGWYYETVGLTTDLLKVLSSIKPTPELAQQQILLQSSLARVLMAINGCTPEVEDAYTHALHLCQKHGEIPQSFPVLRALAGFYSYTADFKRSAGFGEKILDLADQLGDKNMSAEGHLVCGYNLTFLGRVKEGIEHLNKGISIFDPEIHSSQTYRVGNNPVVTSYTTLAFCLWLTGYPDSALKQADSAIVLAKKLNHPFSLAYALFHTGLLYLWRREFDIVITRTQAALEIARMYKFHIWEAAATCLQGAALAGIGKTEDGLLDVKRGMDMYTELKTPPVFWPILLLIQAITFVQSERTNEALSMIDEAVAIIGQSSKSPLLAEFNRLKGELLLIISQDNIQQAESLFRKVLDLTRQQETIMFELRTSMSLTKLLQNQGKLQEAQQLLSTVYNKFSEGFSTIDMIEAKKLLSNLS